MEKISYIRDRLLVIESISSLCQVLKYITMRDMMDASTYKEALSTNFNILKENKEQPQLHKSSNNIDVVYIRGIKMFVSFNYPELKDRRSKTFYNLKSSLSIVEISKKLIDMVGDDVEIFYFNSKGQLTSKEFHFTSHFNKKVSILFILSEHMFYESQLRINRINSSEEEINKEKRKLNRMKRKYLHLKSEKSAISNFLFSFSNNI